MLNLILTHTTGSTIDIIIAILMIIGAYIIGSIPFGIIIGKSICGIDIREHGSKNIGTTNAIRVLGKKVGFIVFFFDVFKGMAMIIVALVLKRFDVFYESPIITNKLHVDYLILGVSAILGHSFSIFLDFKGGKAVATSLGVILMICPTAGVACVLVFLLVLEITGYVSLASTFATLTVLSMVWVYYFVGCEYDSFVTYLYCKQELPICIIISTVAALIILKHKKNYVRLLNGTENSFKKKKDKVETN